MPVRSPHASAIEETLRSSLGCPDENRLEQRLISSSKKVLLHRIEFREAERSTTFQLDNLRTKYRSLNPSQKQGKVTVNGLPLKKASKMSEVEEGLPQPKVWLYPPEKIKPEWTAVRRVGAGLWNMGNTCFLNSVLQCLSYTPPLVNYLLTTEHKNSCRIAGFCMLCELQKHISRCYDQSGSSVKPWNIINKLRLIAKHMHMGRQEDAHEFLRYTVDHMQKACLNGFSKLDRYSRDTTIINQIFGGYLRSQVHCSRCHARSNTYDPFQDLSLDIKHSPSLERALQKFVQAEVLEGENSYNCARCKHKVTAHKRFSIHKPPIVLTIQFKRFDFNRMFGGKVTKHVSFPEKLDIRPYMSNNKGDPIIYQLYGVVVHQGASTNSGHYYCYVKPSNRLWYCMNDSSVGQCSRDSVMGAQAYLLFYIKMGRHVNHILSPSQKPNQQNHFIGPKMPSTQSVPPKSHAETNGSLGTSSDLGKPISRTSSLSSPTGGLFSPQRQQHNHTSVAASHSKPSPFSPQGKPHVLQPKPGASLPVGSKTHTNSKPSSTSSLSSQSPVTKPSPLTSHHKGGEGANSSTPRPSSITPLSQRDRVSFGIKPKMAATTPSPSPGPSKMSATTPSPSPGPSSKVTTPPSGNKLKLGTTPSTPKTSPGTTQNQSTSPRIVMHIKHGKVYTTEQPAEGGSSMVNGASHTGLVPYAGDSDSDDDIPSLVSSAKKNLSFSPKRSSKLPSPGKSSKRSDSHDGSSRLKHGASSPDHSGHNGIGGMETDEPLLCNGPVLDSKLSATTSVPGAYGPLDKLAKYDKVVSSQGKQRRASFDSSEVSAIREGASHKKQRGLFSPLTCVTTSPKKSKTNLWSLPTSPSPFSPSGEAPPHSPMEWHVSDLKDAMTVTCNETQEERRPYHPLSKGVASLFKGKIFDSPNDKTVPDKKGEKTAAFYKEKLDPQSAAVIQNGIKSAKTDKHTDKHSGWDRQPNSRHNSNEQNGEGAENGKEEGRHFQEGEKSGKNKKQEDSTGIKIKRDANNEYKIVPPQEKMRSPPPPPAVPDKDTTSNPSKNTSREKKKFFTFNRGKNSVTSSSEVDTSVDTSCFNGHHNDHHKHKAKKHKKKHKKERDPYEYRSESDSELERKLKKKKKKKKKHRHSDKQHLLDTTTELDSTLEKPWKNHSSQDSEGDTKKFKYKTLHDSESSSGKKSKHRHHDSSDEDRELRVLKHNSHGHEDEEGHKHRHHDSSDGEEDMRGAKHWPHTHQGEDKHRHRHRVSLDGEGTKHRHHLTSPDSEGEKKKLKHRHEKDSQEYRWVEKTKESVEKRHPDKHRKEVPEHQWDEHVRDGYKRTQPEGIAKVRIRWDGTKHTTNVVSELEKHSSSRGYGASVSAWDGGQSHMDQEVDREKQRERKRHWSDEYEEELDRGKVKKLKKHYESEPKYNGNPFQWAQEERNREKHKVKSGWDSHEHRSHYHSSSHHHPGSHPSSHKDAGHRYSYHC